MNKEQLIRQYFSELGKRSVEARKKKYGAEGFAEFLKKIGFQKKANSRKAK